MGDHAVPKHVFFESDEEEEEVPRRHGKHVRFASDEESDDVPGHRGMRLEDVEAEEDEYVEYEEASEEEEQYEERDLLDEAVDALGGIQQTLVTSDGTAVADVLVSIDHSLRRIADALCGNPRASLRK